MNRQEIKEILTAAPDEERVAYFESKFGEIAGWMTTQDKRFLAYWLPKVAANYPVQPMRIAEIGTFRGSTARGLIALSGGGNITCVDNWRDVHDANPRALWEATLKSNGPDLLEYATLIEGDNKEVGTKWSDPIDLLLIDSDHAYDGAISDMKNFANKVISGGYCLVDDYQMIDVERACHEFFGDSWRPVRKPTSEADGKLACWQRV
jgi:hypothetical protein